MPLPEALKAVPEDERAEKVQERVGTAGLEKMVQGMRDMELAQIDMLAPAVLGCNDPIHPPTAENLKRGGMVAKRQLEALLKWWNPTETQSQVETTQNSDQKSTN